MRLFQQTMHSGAGREPDEEEAGRGGAADAPPSGEADAEPQGGVEAGEGGRGCRRRLWRIASARSASSLSTAVGSPLSESELESESSFKLETTAAAAPTATAPAASPRRPQPEKPDDGLASARDEEVGGGTWTNTSYRFTWYSFPP